MKFAHILDYYFSCKRVAKKMLVVSKNASFLPQNSHKAGNGTSALIRFKFQVDYHNNQCLYSLLQCIICISPPKIKIDKLQSRKSQEGTQVRISDLEFSLKTHFPTTHQPIHPSTHPPIHPSTQPSPRESLFELCRG